MEDGDAEQCAAANKQSEAFGLEVGGHKEKKRIDRLEQYNFKAALTDMIHRRPKHTAQHHACQSVGYGENRLYQQYLIKAPAWKACTGIVYKHGNQREQDIAGKGYDH